MPARFIAARTLSRDSSRQPIKLLTSFLRRMRKAWLTVGLVAGLCHDAVGHFLLQHEDRAAAVRVGHDASQDGRADVVRKVADGAVGAGGEGGLDGILQAQVDAVAEALPETREELGIDLDGRQRVRQFGELLRQHALARPDLENRVIRLRLDRGDDPIDRSTVAEKVLAPLLLRAHVC